jgi:hypothetical protein
VCHAPNEVNTPPAAADAEAREAADVAAPGQRDRLER